VQAIRHRISDRYLDGETESRGEQIHFIDSFWCYDPCGMELAVNPLPAEQNGCVTFGSLNNFCKVTEPTLRLWGQVLAGVKDSRLMIMSAAGSHRQRVLATLGEEGIAAERVEFVEPRGRAGYLELYHRMDVMLDTFPYNGHTTSLDALWMGVPVVSLAGASSVARAGLSQLSNLGLPELVAWNAEEFRRIAIQLAGDIPRLAELRRTLRARMETSVLMDAPRFACGIEGAYRAMWRRWCGLGAGR
jgi:predicted O-linked N-acetylglucosamine transferase (SPINDLY family)